MRRILKGRTWRIRGNNAAEASLVVAAAALLVPILIFVFAAAISYREIREQAEERLMRTLDLLYTSVRTTFESEYLIAANVAELLNEYATDGDIRADEQKLHQRLEHLVARLPQVEDVWVLDVEGRPVVAAKVFPLPTGYNYADRAYFAALRRASPAPSASCCTVASGISTSSSTVSVARGRTVASMARSPSRSHRPTLPNSLPALRTPRTTRRR